MYEGHFQVELRELRLTVATRVFVTEAARNLEVALNPCHHQQLFELLGALGQGIELSGVDARRNKIVARSFGCGFEHHRCLDFDEAAL
jgi:hypothetical protein